MVLAAHSQSAHRLRMEWGPTGAAAVAGGLDGAAGADVAVVVDVLSFSTALTVAVEQGTAVHPFRWRDRRAEAYAAERGAVLAGGRSGTGPSLSPASLRGLRDAGVDRLVLPSPNGSTVATVLAGSGATVVGGCLRNRTAVARWLAPRVARGAGVAVVAAGERWPDGSLRPAVEDLWGAGAVLAALVDLGGRPGPAGLSPEARVAEQAFRAVAPGVAVELRGCASGRELVDRGFGEDVEVAAQVDASAVVPVLRGDAFVAA